jgi:LmbE family N-acetylglucosaminyl deacetylase
VPVGRHDGYDRFVRSELLGDGYDIRRVLGFFAHPDDEVFCCGGTFARLADAGAEVYVVSLTRGEKGQIRDAGVATRSTLGDVRVAELHAAAAVLGLTGVHCHDYGDGTLATQPFGRLVDVAAEWLDRIRPHVGIEGRPVTSATR